MADFPTFSQELKMAFKNFKSYLEFGVGANRANLSVGLKVGSFKFSMPIYLVVNDDGQEEDPEKDLRLGKAILFIGACAIAANLVLWRLDNFYTKREEKKW